MKKFQNVESRVGTGRPGTATRSGIPRPPTADQENTPRENLQQRPPTHVAFGKATQRNNSALGSTNQRPPSARQSNPQLTTSNLNKFDRKSNSIGFKKPLDPEVRVFTGEEAKNAAQGAAQEPGPDQTPIHRNYGKVPKYIEKYKEEAADLAKKRDEIRAKKLLPPGMKQMDEAERVMTLEQL